MENMESDISFSYFVSKLYKSSWKPWFPWFPGRVPLSLSLPGDRQIPPLCRRSHFSQTQGAWHLELPGIIRTVLVCQPTGFEGSASRCLAPVGEPANDHT